MYKCNCHGKGPKNIKNSLGLTTSKNGETCDHCDAYVFFDRVTKEKETNYKLGPYEPEHMLSASDFLDYGSKYDYFIENDPDHFANRMRVIKEREENN